jgi:hypothetical protein
MEKRRGSFAPSTSRIGAPLFPLPREAPIREDVAISLFGHGQNLAARRVDLEEAKWKRECATSAASGRRSSQ